jgi:hypothetical protein
MVSAAVLASVSRASDHVLLARAVAGRVGIKSPRRATIQIA